MDAPANGGMVKMNLTVNYNFIPDRVTGLYERFNGMDGEAIVKDEVLLEKESPTDHIEKFEKLLKNHMYRLR